jgi:hypothetical protein
MKNYIKYLFFASLVQASCQNKKMENKTNFVYSMEISAPEEYPVEVHEGVLSKGDQFITAIPKAGIARGGWGFGSGDAGMKAGSIPNHIELTWISYAEKKFWKIDAALPEDKILALFQKGFHYINRAGVAVHETFDILIIGLAPGGVVVLWLDGGVSKKEIGRFQAKEIYVNKLDFEPVKDPSDSQEAYFDRRFKLIVPKATQEEIKQHGIPYGLWDEYRVLYNWRYHTLSYKGDSDEFIDKQSTDFVNGEGNYYQKNNINIAKEYQLQPAPWRSSFTYKDYNADAEFDISEIMTAFKTLNKKHPKEPIDVVVKVAFMYKGLTFIVKCGSDEIPLEKVKVTMYVN